MTATAGNKNGKTKGNGHAPPVKSPTGRYSAEVKATAVARLAAGERATEIAKEIGTSGSMIYAWRKNSESGTTSKPREPKVLADTVVRDAILYLRNAKSEIMRDLSNGKIREMSNAQLLTLLALRTLEGG